MVSRTVPCFLIGGLDVRVVEDFDFDFIDSTIKSSADEMASLL